MNNVPIELVKMKANVFINMLTGNAKNNKIMSQSTAVEFVESFIMDIMDMTIEELKEQATKK